MTKEPAIAMSAEDYRTFAREESRAAAERAARQLREKTRTAKRRQRDARRRNR